MAEARLGPEELDRLEDALEGLETLDDLSDPSPAVSARLADFKLILETSREALPIEEVPAGLLTGVLAEASMSSEDIQTPSPVRETEGFWARMRRAWLIPGLAVAGSAALVLLLLQPTMSDDARAVPESVAVQDAQVPHSPSAAAPAGDAEPEESEEEDAREESAASVRPPAAAPASGEVLDKAAAPMPAQREAVKADAFEDGAGWTAVEEGDTARKGGDCFTARNHYAQALDDGNDSVRARAYVGMGLCKREEGNEAAAKEYFTKARELDEDAVEFAGTQNRRRAKRPRPRAPAKKASGKRKSSMTEEEVADPRQGL